jgi:iduronate 2-sulfatase
VSRIGTCIGAVLLLAVGSACVLLAPGKEPPPARGVVLVLASGLGGGVDAKRTPTLARLGAGGRAFEAAFAPDPDPAAARAALVGPLIARLRSRGLAVAGVGDAVALPIDTSALGLHLPGSVTSEAAAAGLGTWLRTRRETFVVIAAVGGDPVRPALAPGTLAGAFAPPLPRIAVADLGFSDRPGAELRPAAWSEPARQRAEATQLERALLADRELGALLTQVERAAPGAATIVVGDPPPDRGLHGRLERNALFDDTLRAALVVATPGLSRPGRTSSRLVSTLDVIPTLLALAGAPPEPDGEGRSLMPLLADPAAPGRSEVVSSVARRAGRLGRSLRSARFRYNAWPDGSRELYDHDADPGEQTNLASRPEHAATIAELERALATDDAAREPEAPVARPGTTARPRNVVLIVVDDLNTRVGTWGAPVQTPAIDRLAARGVRFDRAYAQVAMCSPSRASMLTGWRPERTGVWQNEDPPRPARAVPLQELFAAHGAVTAGIGKIYHSPADFRWDVPETQLDEPEEHPDPVEGGPGLAGNPGSGLWVAAPGADVDQPDGRRARRAVSLVERQGARPFFLALGLVRPHRMWIAPARYFGLYPPESIVLTPSPGDDLADVPAIAVKTQPQPLPGLPLLGREPPGLVRDPALRRQAIAAYQACVSFADAQVGLVLDALDHNDRWKDTVVVLVGDNGFHLGEHGGLLRKDTLFEEALRVPLVVAAPGLPHPGAVVRTPVELLDVYPTIVELAGLQLPSDLDGQSLVPLLENPEGAGRGFARSWRRVQPPERGVSLRTAGFRYTLWPDGSEELYEPRGAAPESENLATRPQWAAQKARLRARLEALVAVVPKAP